MSTLVKTFFGIATLFLTLFFISPSSVSAVTYNLVTTTNFNLRIDGPEAGSTLGLGQWDTMELADINNNGRADLIVGFLWSDNNSRANSGSFYVIYDDLLQKTGTGNTIDLADSSNWNIRYDGSAAEERLGADSMRIGDFDNDGKNDLVLGAKRADYNSRNDSGSVYLISNTLIDDYSGTGNTVDLATSSTYTYRFDGASANNTLADQGMHIADVNGNNKADLMITNDDADNNSRSNSGSVYLILDSILDDYTGTGNTIDLAVSTNYNARFDGTAASDFLREVRSGDINNDGNEDLIMGAIGGDKTFSSSGSVFIIYSTAIAALSGTGNNIDLNTSSNYNLRIDGPAANTTLGLLSKNDGMADINNDGDEDLLLVAYSDDVGLADSGSLYILDSDIISSYTGTGNTFDLSSSSNYSIRITGQYAVGRLSYHGFLISDFDGDSRLDIAVQQVNGTTIEKVIISGTQLDAYTGTGNDVVISSLATTKYTFTGISGFNQEDFDFDLVNSDGTMDIAITIARADNNSRTDSGSVYLIYNFPHSISVSSNLQVGTIHTVIGTITASNSTTAVSGVQYQMDSNSPASGWSDCTAGDGSFNSTSESFTCTSSTAPTTSGTHTMYIRAYDANGSYTAQSAYKTVSYGVPASTSSGSSSSSSYEPPPVQSASGGVVASDTVSIIVAPGSVPFTANISNMSILPAHLPKGCVAPKNAIGDIHELWLIDYYNRAKILTRLHKKASIVALRYNIFQLLTTRGKIAASRLRLAYSVDCRRWKILSSSVVDVVNHTVAAIHKVGGYYSIVSR